MGRHHDGVETAPADHVDFSADRGGAGRAARHCHRWQCAPAIRRGIIFKRVAAGAFVHRSGKAAERENFPIGHGNAEVVAPFRQRSAHTPRIGRRIVFIVIRPGRAIHRAAQRMQLAVKRDCRHFAARSRQRRLHGPRSGRRLCVDGDDGCQTQCQHRQQRRTDKDVALHRNRDFFHSHSLRGVSFSCHCQRAPMKKKTKQTNIMAPRLIGQCGTFCDIPERGERYAAAAPRFSPPARARCRAARASP